jgi:UDP-N-acetyl-D-glucosamine dehydrogenase
LKDTLAEKLKNHSAVIGVFGLGYVGLPLAIEYCLKGFRCIGFEISTKKINLINSGKSDIGDVSNAQVKDAVSKKLLRATADFSLLKQCDVAAICVPTPLSKTKDPDVSFILRAVEELQKYLHKEMLVILESTTYPGTTEELILPILETTGLRTGKDFYLAFSPERVDPGNAKYGTKNTPRVVGGHTSKCQKMAKLFYEQAISHVHLVSSTQAAEMVKLLENTFRSVNIGLVNEVALMCDRLKINCWEIIDAASTKPFGFMPFYPGPGLGGHCIPIDPHYLSWKLKSLNYYSRFIELAGDINSHMPEYVQERITRLLNKYQKPIKGSRILVLGVAYKRDIADLRESPAIDCIRLLQKQGAKVQYNDPYAPLIKMEEGEKDLRSTKLTPALLKAADLVVILTDHTNYDYESIVKHSRLIFDTRNATKRVKGANKKVERL